METRPSDKKLVTVLGIAAGAGIALTFLYRGINKKGPILHPATAHPELTRATISSSRRSLLAHGLNSGTISHDQQAPIAVPAGTGSVIRAAVQTKAPEDVQALCDRRVRIWCAASDEPDAQPHAVALPPAPDDAVKPSIHGAPAVLSMTHRLGASALDAWIIFLACCIFVGLSRAWGVNAQIDRFDIVILTCSVSLIAVFYTFLFKIAGRGTLGQTWQKRRLKRAFEHQREAQDSGETITQPAGDFALLAAWTPKTTVSRKYARSSPS
jgi:hypothetical protein